MVDPVTLDTSYSLLDHFNLVCQLSIRTFRIHAPTVGALLNSHFLHPWQLTAQDIIAMISQLNLLGAGVNITADSIGKYKFSFLVILQLSSLTLCCFLAVHECW